MLRINERTKAFSFHGTTELKIRKKNKRKREEVGKEKEWIEELVAVNVYVWERGTIKRF